MPIIREDSRLLQHTASSASRNLGRMAQFPNAFNRRASTVESVTYAEAHRTALAMRKRLESAGDSGSSLNRKKQSMIFDFEKRIPDASYYRHQNGEDSSKATLMAMKKPPFDNIFHINKDTKADDNTLKGHVLLNSIVGTEDRGEKTKRGGEVMLKHAELVAKSQDKKLTLAAFYSKNYWAGQGFYETDFEQREKGAEAHFPVMTKRPKPTI